MIPDERVDKAVDYLVNSAAKAAKCRADRWKAEHYRKSLKAILMGEKLGETLGAQEQYAESNQRYIDHLRAARDLVFADELCRVEREAAVMLIETWRTYQANLRSIKI
mgnify:CR=1 FL=1